MQTDPLYWRQAGNGPPLLLIHGLLLTGAMFEPVQDALASSFRVLAPDLRGAGRSRPLPPPDTVAQHARDLAAGLHALSLSSVAVLGYSQGGAVAQQLALDYPGLVSRLILACTFAHNQMTWSEKLEGQVLPWLVRLLSARQLAGLMPGLTPAQRQALEAMISSNDKGYMVAATRTMLAFDSRARLGDIGCPTLIVTGEKDQAVPFHHARQLAQGIPGARLHVIPQAGHEMIWTHGPALVEAVEDFLRQT